MAIKIPTFDSSREIYTGSTGPHATSDSFGVDATPLQAGLLQIGRGAEHLADAEAHVARTKKNQGDVSWATDSVMQERMHLSEWMSDPKNNSSPEFSNQFKKYAADRLREYQKSAPSPEASRLFSGHMGEWVASHYATALQTTERTRINNSILSVDNQISDALKSFRDTQNVPNTDPVLDLESNLHLIHDSIQSQFGEVAPGTAQKLQEHLAKQAILGIGATHPEDARRILNKSTTIDEETRKTLSSFLDQASKSRDIVAEDQFARDRKDHLASVFFGKTAEKIPLNVYEIYYDKDRAQIYKAHDDEIIGTYTRANTAAAEIAGKNPGAQIAMLDKLQISAATDQDKNVIEILGSKVKQNLTMLSKNRVGWLTDNNPQVAALQKQFSEATDPIVQRSIMSRRNEAILKFQGVPPPGTPPAEAEFYLGLPSNDRHLMTQDEAASNANKINQGSPADAVKAISQILAQYPDAAHQYTVFSDMVTIPQRGQGIRQEYQLAFQNKDAWWVDSYVAAISNVKDVAKLDDEKRKDILTQIESNPTWKKFQQSMIGDGFERANEIEGFKSGILAFSHALSLGGGKDVKQATSSAVERLIHESLGFTPVNTQYLAIARKFGDTHRTDEEIQNIGRRLSMSLKYVDPRALDQSHFPGLRVLGEESSVERSQALRDIITSRGFFVTGNDGQSASLHIQDDSGIPFEVTDKNGAALSIHFDDMPPFTSTMMMGASSMGPTGMRPANLGQRVTVPDSPSKTYPLRQGGGMWSKLFGSGQVTTNWPSIAPWIQPRKMPVFTPPTRPIMSPPAEDPVEKIQDLIGMPPDER